MNSNESELEQQLRTLRPREVSPALEDRLAAALDRREVAVVERAPASAVLRRTPVAPASQWWRGWVWALAGAAATALVFATLHGGTAPIGHEKAEPAIATAAPEEFEHTESSEALVTTEDEGLVLGEDEEPLRQVHSYTVERHVWTNAHTGERMEFEIPREDVRFMPVAMQ